MIIEQLGRKSDTMNIEEPTRSINIRRGLNEKLKESKIEANGKRNYEIKKCKKEGTKQGTIKEKEGTKRSKR